MVLQVKTSFELSPSTLEETESIIMMITTWFVARQARTTSLFNSHLQDGVNLILLLKKIFRFPFYIQWWFSKEAYLTRFAAMLQNLLLVLVARFTLTFSLQCRRFLRSREFFFSRKRHVETTVPILLCHKIKDGGYNNTNMNKLSSTQNTLALRLPSLRRLISHYIGWLLRGCENHIG